ncbi:conserved hypothetical protein [Flavobacterium sp. 9AF]|uniref:carboxypeptidase-like regulatory domain-containing protein n=1 Tax=Flavobacterium sp. 9AF TaxID=2653142 RepID=UPI0012F405EA|nr:carboxypeptidase-like regulatory domain-containing protein [Flavobacterium sp. 9AF]VXB54745.1 conserved hypothetical protein [Flavobacterium sp. 9AF]
MATKIRINVPSPCHENWHAMAKVEKGRFCSSCQKKVHDFTNATDTQIIAAIDGNDNLCGRFLKSQLDRTIEKPNQKRKKWLALATLTGFLSWGTQEVFSQGEPVKMVQTDTKVNFNKISPTLKQEIMFVGSVYDTEGPLAGATINVKGTQNYTTSDFNGNFSIKAKSGDTLVVNYIGYKTYEEIVFQNIKEYKIILEENRRIEDEVIVVAGGAFIKRSFFGRIFHRIGNFFR